jgi:capsular polysaccharide biosynthesis protein
MPPDTSATDRPAQLYPESFSTRRLPINIHQPDLPLFSHELEKAIPETSLLALKNVRVSCEGLLFNGRHLLPESFAFPANMKQWRRRSLIKFFASNYLLRRTRTIDRDALWITDDWSNGYFHWLTDALTRLYVMRQRLDQFLLLLPSDYAGLDFVQSSLKCFAVKNVEFVKPDEVLLCRTLFMPTHTAPSGHYSHELIAGVRDQLLQTFGDTTDARPSERVYISRGRARKRRIVNETAVADLLSEFGFQVVYAEELTFEQQVRLCSRTRYLVSNHGAGLTNMLFLPEGAAVLELRHQTDATNNCYFTLASALGLNYFYQTCQPADNNQDPHSADLIVDLDCLKTNLALLIQPLS